jgi:hypothetical protein
MNMLARNDIWSYQGSSATTLLVLRTTDQITTALANEMKYVIYHTTETRLPVPTAIVSQSNDFACQ